MKFVVAGAITLAVMLALSFGIPDPQEAHGTRVAGIIFGVVIAAIPIYNFEKWTLLQRSLAHFAVMVGVVVPCLMWSGWFEWRTPSGLMALIGSFIGFGVVGWIVGYVVSKSLERRSKKS